MPRSERLLAPVALLGLVLTLTAACAGPPIPAPVEGVPVCADFELGRARMEGTLRHPVRMRVLEGKTVLFKHMITGLRRADDPRPRTLIIDDNAEYTVEWAQCANERAPRSISDAAHASGKARDKGHEPETGYDCGEATVYKTEKLVTRKHDSASHTITFAAPPEASCWQGDAASPNAPAPTVAALMDGGTDAAAAPAPPVASDAGALDAGAK